MAPERRRGVSQEGMEAEARAQTATDRRVLRSHYRSLKAAIANDKGSISRLDVTQFNSLVGSVDELYGRVHRPRELIADAEAVHDITAALVQSLSNFHGKTGPSPGDFVAAIAAKVGGETVDWNQLGEDASSVFRDAPGLPTMLGPMDIEAKQRKARASRVRGKPAESTCPEQLAEAGVEEKSATDKNMETMFKVLRASKRVRLDALVLNRGSFAQTVENLFSLSFLVKDGRVELTFDEDKNPVLVPRNAPSGEDRANGSVLNSAFVFRLDFNDWKFMQSRVEPGQELMPDRGSSSSSACRSSLTPVRKTSRNRAREMPSAVEEQAVVEDSEEDEEEDEEEDDENQPGRRKKSRP